MAQNKVASRPARVVVISLQKGILWLSKYWAIVAFLLIILFLALAFLSPAFMSTGQTATAQAIYRFLAWNDHQLPQRSYFLFGHDGGIHSYSLKQIILWGGEPDNLRAFVGNPEIGFKMGLNHRMTAIFVAMTIGSFIWLATNGKPTVRFIPLLMMTLPLFLDAFSHANSEISDGFRETNAWAAFLTANSFPDTFYQGTTIGTLNWLLRTITGFIFGLGLSWFLFGYLSRRFKQIRQDLEPRLVRAGIVKEVKP